MSNPTWEELPGYASMHISDLEQTVKTLCASIDAGTFSLERIRDYLNDARDSATEALKATNR